MSQFGMPVLYLNKMEEEKVPEEKVQEQQIPRPKRKYTKTKKIRKNKKDLQIKNLKGDLKGLNAKPLSKMQKIQLKIQDFEVKKLPILMKDKKNADNEVTVFKDRYYSLLYVPHGNPVYLYRCDHCLKEFNRFVEIRAHVGRKHKGLCDSLKRNP